MAQHKLGQSDSRDPERVEQLDREAHEHFYIQRALDAGVRVELKLATLFERFGDHATASLARRDAREDLRAAQGEGERALDLLIEEEIVRDIQMGAEGVAKLKDGQIQLRTAVGALYEVVHSGVPQQNAARREVERLYPQLQERLAQPIEDRLSAVAFLEVLDIYLKLVQKLAQSEESVRAIWLEQAGILVNVL